MRALLMKIWKSWQKFLLTNANYEMGTYRLNTPTKVILHCAATPDLVESKFGVEDIRKWHVNGRGWRDIGYHYYITRDGFVHKGREEHEIGAHTRGYNTGSLGICYEGTYFPTLAQISAMIILYKVLLSRWGITLSEWHGHNEYSNKECPGFNIEDLRSIFLKVS